MKFRDDIDPATTWVVSDTHFGHENIVGHCHRPEDHEQAIIAEWRKAIPEDHTVLHLGDLNYGGNARFKNLTSKELTGKRKLLIQGNHDRQRFSHYKQSGFSIVQPFKLRLRATVTGFKSVTEDECRGPFSSATQPIIVSFSHYPWNPEEDGGVQPSNHWRIHGHIHNNGYTRNGYVPFLKNHLNLSVEQTRYSPVNLKLLLDAAILGVYAPTTDEQMDEVRERRAENYARKAQA